MSRTKKFLDLYSVLQNFRYVLLWRTQHTCCDERHRSVFLQWTDLRLVTMDTRACCYDWQTCSTTMPARSRKISFRSEMDWTICRISLSRSSTITVFCSTRTSWSSVNPFGHETEERVIPIENQLNVPQFETIKTVQHEFPLSTASSCVFNICCWYSVWSESGSNT